MGIYRNNFFVNKELFKLADYIGASLITYGFSNFRVTLEGSVLRFFVDDVGTLIEISEAPFEFVVKLYEGSTVYDYKIHKYWNGD